MKAHAIVVAAGQGTRVSADLPKQFCLLGGKPLYRWSLDALTTHKSISSVCLVLPEGSETLGEQSFMNQKGVLLTNGGKTRSQSVRNGLKALNASESDYILIHDAARPGLSHDMIDRLLDALTSSDAAAPALPVSDALKREQGGHLQTVQRQGLYRIQTPQAFKVGAISSAFCKEKADFVDDLEAIEDMGLSVSLIDGDHRLDKITFMEDFDIMERLLVNQVAYVRNGTGFDVHKFEAGDHVIICGVTIPHSKGLEGHSDADVGWHALTDAILGAAAKGDIGDHFPPSDPKWKNAPSEVFLQHAMTLVRADGWELQNCDITLICEAPKISPHREAMRSRTAKIAGTDISQISIKATTTEGLGFTGRGEGIAAQAIATLVQKTPGRF